MTRWLAACRARIALPLLQGRALLRGRLQDRRLWRDGVAQRLWFDAPEGRVAATLRVPNAPHRVPAVVFVHGSHGPIGLDRVLSARLVGYGIAVLAIELPGFGRSPVPPAPWRPEQFTGQGVMGAAFIYLQGHPRVDAGRISLCGHSFGGSVAVTASLALPPLHTVIAIGPTRRLEERFLSGSAREGLQWLARFSTARRLRPWATMEIVRAVSRMVGLEYQVGAWQRPAHPPLLLIDGECESQVDRQFLAVLTQAMTPPLAHRTLPASDHYLNTAGLGPYVLYDRRAVETCVQWIVEWIGRHPSRVAHALTVEAVR